MKTPGIVSFNDTKVAFASKTDSQLKKMHFLFSLMNKEYLTKISTKLIIAAIKMHFPIGKMIKSKVFDQFCGGETLEECIPVIQNLGEFGINTILDYAAEGKKEEIDFEKTVDLLFKIIETDSHSDTISFSVLKVSSIASSALLEKVQKGSVLSVSETDAYDKVKIRLEKVCEKAVLKKVRLFIDAEESWIQGAIDVLILKMMNKYNKQEPFIFNTFQMYRKDMGDNLKEALKISKIANFHLGVKLVRGAYLEKEKTYAQERNMDCPIYSTKQDTDNSFNEALKLCVDHINTMELCCGSHNEDSNLFLTQLMEIKGLARNDKRITFSQLFGMSDHISFNLAAAGYNVSKYLPFGKVEQAVPYLIRRAQENKAVAGNTSRELKLIKEEMSRRNI